MKLLISAVLISVTVAFCGLNDVFAFNTKAGTKNPAAFIDIGSGARSIALGRSFVSIAGGAEGFLYNPAGLPFNKKFELTNMTALMSLDRSIFNAGAVYTLTVKKEELPEIFIKPNPLIGRVFEESKYSRYGFGVFYSHFGVRDIEGRDIWGERTHNFDDTERMVLFGAGYSPYENFGIGMNIKSISQKLESSKASAIGADLGLIYKIPHSGYTLGFSAKDISRGMKWDIFDPSISKTYKYYENIPAKYVLGGSFVFGDWLVSSDLNKYEGSGIFAAAGCEYLFSDNFVLRGGIDRYNPLLGIGFLWHSGRNLDAGFDYAFKYDTDGLANVHYLSINMAFSYF